MCLRFRGVEVWGPKFKGLGKFRCWDFGGLGLRFGVGAVMSQRPHALFQGLYHAFYWLDI